jgi:hypothetical protein
MFMSGERLASARLLIVLKTVTARQKPLRKFFRSCQGLSAKSRQGCLFLRTRDFGPPHRNPLKCGTFRRWRPTLSLVEGPAGWYRTGKVHSGVTSSLLVSGLVGPAREPRARALPGRNHYPSAGNPAAVRMDELVVLRTFAAVTTVLVAANLWLHHPHRRFNNVDG